MTQSKLASENVTPKTARNAAERRAFARVHRGSRSSSWWTDRPRIAIENQIHTAPYTSARVRKNGRVSQTRLNAVAVSVDAPKAPLVHVYSSGRQTRATARRATAKGSVPAMASGTRRMATLQLAPVV